MKQNGELYECYSKKLFHFLQINGFFAVRTFVHRKTQKKCWVFKVTPLFSEALKQWSETNPTNQDAL